MVTILLRSLHIGYISGEQVETMCKHMTLGMSMLNNKISLAHYNIKLFRNMFQCVMFNAMLQEFSILSSYFIDK